MPEPVMGQHAEKANAMVVRHEEELHDAEIEALVDRDPETGERPGLLDRIRRAIRRAPKPPA